MQGAADSPGHSVNGLERALADLSSSDACDLLDAALQQQRPVDCLLEITQQESVEVLLAQLPQQPVDCAAACFAMLFASFNAEVRFV